MTVDASPKSLSPGTTSKPASRQTRRSVQDELRRQIVRGFLPAGARIPSRPMLEQAFGASRHTVQHAIDQLRREGFLRVEGRQATFVVDRPPHQFHYAMVFKTRPQHGFETWSRFFRALVTEADRYSGTPDDPRRLSVFYGVENHLDCESFTSLAEMIRQRRLAGIILPEHPLVTGLASLAAQGAQPPLPWVSFGAAGGATVQLLSYHERALDCLVRQGCRRPAFLMSPSRLHDGSIPLDRQLMEGATSRGMQVQPYWCQAVHLDLCPSARGITHLLFHRNQSIRPDCLMITDDNLVEPALAGLLDAGIRVPEDVTVMAHWNFPIASDYPWPILRVGFDARTILAACLEELGALQSGKAPGIRALEAILEEPAPHGGDLASKPVRPPTDALIP